MAGYCSSHKTKSQALTSLLMMHIVTASTLQLKNYTSYSKQCLLRALKMFYVQKRASTNAPWPSCSTVPTCRRRRHMTRQDWPPAAVCDPRSSTIRLHSRLPLDLVCPWKCLE